MIASRSNSIGGVGARVNWDRFVLDAGLAVPLTQVGPDNASPTPVSDLADHPLVAMELPMNVHDFIRVPPEAAPLLLSCATLAIAAALIPQKRRAQAFKGTPTPSVE